MNFLQLVNRARRECGVSGAALSTVAAATLTMEGQRFVDWVSDSWNDLQMEKADWQWMRKNVNFPTAIGQQAYTLAQSNATDCAMWKLDSFRAYITAVGTNDEQILPYMAYDSWRNIYQYGANRTTVGRPVALTMAPDKTLAIGPVPDALYTVTGEYYRAPTALTLDTDDPSAAGNDFPSRYHMLLVYMAMDKYAAYESAPEVATRAKTDRMRLRAMLMRDYLPMISFGGPLG